MDLKQFDSIDTENPAEVKKLQRFLKTRGYYAGAEDGKWGGGTTEGAKRLREELRAAEESERTTRQSESSAKTATARAEEAKNDPVNNAIRGATEIGPYAAGAGVGAVVGHKGAKALAARDAAQTDAVNRIAKNPDVGGGIAENQLGRMARDRNLRTGAQFLAPAALLGSAELIRSHVAPQFQDEETKKWINLGANADQGAGLGLLTHQLVDLKNRIGSPNDPEAEAVIRTRAYQENPNNPLLRAVPSQSVSATPSPPAPQAIAAPTSASPAPVPQPEAPRVGTKEHMRQQARDLEIKGYTKLSKADLAERIAEVTREQGSRRAPRLPKTSIAGPVVAGIVAGGMALGDDANAADGTPRSLGNRLLRATAAGGVGAGLAYGANKLLGALGPAGSVAGGVMGPVSAMSIDPLEGGSREDAADNIRVARGQASHYAPWLAEKVMGIPRSEGQTYDMGQVPERNPLRAQAPQQTPEQELPSAAALEIPSDMGAEPAQEPEGDFETQFQELQAMLQQIGAAQEPGPVANAANSQAASRAQFAPSPWQTTTVPTNRLLASY